MSDKQAQDYYLDSITGHRPTYKRAEDFKRYSAEDLREEVFREFRFGGYSENQNKQKEISPEDRKALKVLGLNAPATTSEIKRKYKELAKRYHPDVKIGRAHV